MSLQQPQANVVQLNSLFGQNYALRRKLQTTQQALAASRAQAVDQDTQLTHLKSRMAQDAKARKAQVLRPVHASQGLECEYRRKLQCLIEAMNRSVCYWVTAAYRANVPELTEELAQDAIPANALKRSIRRVAKRWHRDFNEAAKEMAVWFARANHRRSTSALDRILKTGGWSVKFRMTPAQQDIFQATVHENVALIRSIPQQYFTQIEGQVMRSVQSGRDLQQLTRDLQRTYGVTQRRARLIARDQNNKVTSAFTRAHQVELGITKAIWMHSHAGKTPRRTHVQMDGEEYDVRKGMWDADERQWVLPGQLVNCRCVSRSVIPGFS